MVDTQSWLLNSMLIWKKLLQQDIPEPVFYGDLILKNSKESL